MLESFFSASPRRGGTAETLPPIILLSGISGKTSLLFQFAINRAWEGRGSVIFICSKRRLEHKPPFLSQGVDASSDVLARIEMKYIEDYEGITKYFAAFHLHKRFPSAVIIDDFAENFADGICQHRYGNARGRDLAMARSLALCQDAIVHANQKLDSKGSCKLLLADTHQGDNARQLFIYKRWVNCILTVHSDVPGTFILKNNNIPDNCQETRSAAKYSVALQTLLLEEIFEV